MGGLAKGLGNVLGDITGGIVEGVGAVPDFKASLDPQVLAQQQQFITALQQQKGTPSDLGAAQLKLATGQNIAQAAGLAASQKGISPALAARQAQQQRAAIQQQSAAQSGVLSAQQQIAQQAQELQRQQLMGQMLGQQQQQRLAQQQLQAGLEQTAAQIKGQIAGGLLNAAGSAASMGAMSDGGQVDGVAVAKGDSLANDNVPAMLSPGEIVIPRSIVNHKNAGELAKKFVEETLKSKPNQKEKYADGGQVAPLEQFAQYIQESKFTPYAEQLAQEQEARKRFQLAQTPAPMMEQPLQESNILSAFMPETQNISVPKAPVGPETSMTVKEQPKPQPVGQMPMPAVTPEAPDIYGYGSTASALMKGLGQQKAGLFGEAAAMGAAGKQQAQLLNKYNADLMTRQLDFEKNTADLKNQIKQTSDELTKAKIDPNRYVGDMSTPQRITTTIGLILGGIGGGLTGKGGNVALDVLNKQIDRDIEAQKVNLNQKNTLLSEYYKQYGNMKDAEMMTRATMADIVSNQLKEIAGASQDPLSRARALQAAGKIDTDSAQLIGTIAAKKAIMGGATQAQQVPPEMKIRALVPEAQQKEYYKELQDMQNTVKTRDNILSAFDKIKNMATIGHYVTSPLQTNRQINAIKDPLVAALSKETAGRFTEQDAGMLEPIFPKVGDSEATLRAKKAALDNLISDKMNFPVLKPLGITPETMSRYSFGKGGEKGITLGAPVLKGK